MTDQRDDHIPTGPIDVERIIPPEQPPMDDAAGPQADDVTTDDPATDDVTTEDLSVQGGE